MLAVISNIIQETEVVRRIELEIHSLQKFDFIPGQFVVITFPNLPEGDNERSYSISSPPGLTNKFELCIVLKPDGGGTQYLWTLGIGDQLEISEAKGAFILPEKIETDIAFICTGTGIAPFRSMLVHIFENKIEHKDIYLVFGNRFEKDILYKSEFESMSRNFDTFHFIPVLSRQEGWTGEKGYVHALYETLFSDQREARFFVCGWEAMCKEARHRLKAMGYNRRQYFFEEYG